MKRTTPTLTSYFFERSQEDIVNAVVDDALEETSAARRGLDPLEEEVLREQDRMLFEADELMQSIFDGDFEEYWNAMRNPDVLSERLERYRNLVEDELDGMTGDHDAPSSEWNDRLRWGRSWEGPGGPTPTPVSHGVDINLEDDDLYVAATDWSMRVNQITTRLYYDDEQKDIDIFRAHTSAMIVPAKIMWGSAILAMDESNTALGLQGYELSAQFLKRAMTALQAMRAKDFGVADAIADCLDAAKDLQKRLEHRMHYLKQRSDDDGDTS